MNINVIMHRQTVLYKKLIFKIAGEGCRRLLATEVFPRTRREEIAGGRQQAVATPLKQNYYKQ